jgi:hypothetical protein
MIPSTLLSGTGVVAPLGTKIPEQTSHRFNSGRFRKVHRGQGISNPSPPTLFSGWLVVLGESDRGVVATFGVGLGFTPIVGVEGREDEGALTRSLTTPQSPQRGVWRARVLLRAREVGVGLEYPQTLQVQVESSFEAAAVSFECVFVDVPEVTPFPFVPLSRSPQMSGFSPRKSVILALDLMKPM